MAAAIIPKMPSTPVKNITPTTPTKPQLLKPTGENLQELSPELAKFLREMRSKVEQRIWPVAGGFQVKLEPFPKFREFSKEIRERIWRAACREGRVVEITSPPFRSPTPCPPVMHATTESRKQALVFYEPLVIGRVKTRSYINWNMDTIYISTHINSMHSSLAEVANKYLFANCQHLALTSVQYNSIRQNVHLANLKDLIVVYEDGNEGNNNKKTTSDRGMINFTRTDLFGPEQVVTLQPSTNDHGNWATSKIDCYTVKLLSRNRGRRAYDSEKNTLKYRRHSERKTVEPIRSDEDAAIRYFVNSFLNFGRCPELTGGRLQYELDHRISQ